MATSIRAPFDSSQRERVDARSIVTQSVGLEEAPGVLAALAEEAPGYGEALYRPEGALNRRQTPSVTNNWEDRL